MNYEEVNEISYHMISNMEAKIVFLYTVSFLTQQEDVSLGKYKGYLKVVGTFLHTC